MVEKPNVEDFEVNIERFARFKLPNKPKKFVDQLIGYGMQSTVLPFF